MSYFFLCFHPGFKISKQSFYVKVKQNIFNVFHLSQVTIQIARIKERLLCKKALGLLTRALAIIKKKIRREGCSGKAVTVPLKCRIKIILPKENLQKDHYKYLP